MNTGKVDVLLGLQWGDEGKGKVVDVLTPKYDVIARFQGGPNAGHTLEFEGQKYVLRSIPSGIFQGGKVNIIGNGVVLAPDLFMQEAKDLEKSGHDLKNRLYISKKAHLIMPTHRVLDAAIEASKGKNKVGTTGKGIGPTYTDKYQRIGFKVQDLYDLEALKEKLDIILPLKNKQLEKVYGLEPFTKDCITGLCEEYAKIFKPYVCFDWQKLLNEHKKDTILFEGAQGVMLDVDYGTYPYVTSSNPIGGGAATGSGYGPCMIDEVVGVAKAYVTRVGEGPFVTELNDEVGAKIREIGHEYGVTTGRPRRCGWFDAVTMKYAVLVGGLTSIALTKADVFDTFDEIKVCTAYKDTRNGKVYDYYPTDIYMHKYLEPVYETFEGWKTDISGIRDYDKLPENTRKYLARLEELLDCPIKIVSVGPDREQTIFRG